MKFSNFLSLVQEVLCVYKCFIHNFTDLKQWLWFVGTRQNNEQMKGETAWYVSASDWWTFFRRRVFFFSTSWISRLENRVNALKAFYNPNFSKITLNCCLTSFKELMVPGRIRLLCFKYHSRCPWARTEGKNDHLPGKPYLAYVHLP